MPLHDWTRVDAGIYHSFHNLWIAQLNNALNGGILPTDYYALVEQHAGRTIGEVLTLHGSRPNGEPPSSKGGIAVAEAPPKVRRELTAIEAYGQLRRTLAIRHISGHRLIALVEIVSPANKDRPESVKTFVTKAIEALDMGIHILLLDLLPPGRHDPDGLHGAVWSHFDQGSYDLPADEPLTVASYSAGPQPKAYLEHFGIGSALRDMPLFLQSDRYVLVPLEQTYRAAYRGVPSFWREVLERPDPPAKS